MYNYIKCKYKLNLTEEEKNSIERDWEKITFLCDPILGKVGEFLIRGNGELCHNVTEFEKVDDSEIGERCNLERNGIRTDQEYRVGA